VLHPWELARPTELGLDLLRLLLAELPLKTAVRIAAEASGGSRNSLYQAALRLKDSGALGSSEEEGEL